MTTDDIDAFAALLGDPEVMRYYPQPKTREEALGWIEAGQRSYREHGYGHWLMTTRDTEEFVGICGLSRQSVEGEVFIEVRYLVRTSLQKRGYATEAATACRDHRGSTDQVAD